MLAISMLASAASIGICVPGAARAQSSAEAKTSQYDIASKPLSEALADFGQQSGLEVSTAAEVMRGRTSPGVLGRMSATQALSRLLAGTGLTYRIKDGFVTLEPAPQSAQSDGAINLGTLRVEGEQGSGSGIDRSGNAGTGGAAGGADEIFAAPRAVSVVTREEMDRTPARHAADLIAEVPGVTSAVNRLNPGLSVNIRGMQDFGRVNMMIDGMRQNFVQNGHQQRNGQMYVDPELITSVVIERGPRNDVHGAGAIAGTVDFRTTNPEDILDGPNDRIGARVRATTGSNGVKFLGSAAIAGQLTDNLEVIAAYSRREIGDYDIGSHGETAANNLTSYDGIEINRIKYASQKQESALGKLRWTLGDHQLQLSYIGTWLNYNNVSDSYSSSLDSNGSAWDALGWSRISNQNFAFDYSWKPESKWIDLKLKLYYSNTRNRNYTDARYPDGMVPGDSQVDFAWEYGHCETDPITVEWQSYCGYGYGSNQLIGTKTYGVQLDNTSQFDLGHGTTLKANYGVEFYQDRANSSVVIDREGRIIDTYNQYGQGDTLNPRGRRSMGSLFANFEAKNDFFTLAAGLRYERYWLKGTTQVLGVKSTYNDRFAQMLASTRCDVTTGISTASATTAPGRRSIAICSAAASGGEAAAAAAYDVAFGTSGGYWTARGYTPNWIDSTGYYEYDVNRSQGRFLPSFSAAIRPTSWLELYGRWAKSWRPPAINETLMTGGHPGDPIANMYANPYADPEKTTTWELGANVNFNGIFKSDDAFFAKVGYFSTRATDYLYTSIANNLPGDNLDAISGLGRVMFVNNRTPMHFRGFELEARYDAGFVYAGAAATIYTGSNNTFTQDLYPAGAGTSKYDQPNEDGSLTAEAQMAQAAGYPSWQAWAEAQVVAGAPFNSVMGSPIDKVTATLGARLFQRRLDTGVRLTYSGPGGLLHNIDYDVWPSYVTFDWYGSFTLSKRVRFFASVENLTDRRYVDGKGDFMAMVAAPGRTFTGGIQMQF
ncbi:TonB-dependent hemoglobin/transferrin/lactoferrin family receptor [Sphingomonas sp. H39-1-10]|nr:TonB-dependent hemoglobin/transferrin/lactoferrin family receptor [Sphingomonas pollutisoli]